MMTELQLVWGWQPALYLFLGGMGGGAFVMSAVLFRTDFKNCRKTIERSMWAAALCLIVGLLLLLSELVFPLRGMLLWQSFSHWTSWMTFGAWVVFAAVIDFCISAFLLSDKRKSAKAGKEQGEKAEAEKNAEAKKYLSPDRSSLCKVLVTIGAVLGVLVAVYTGLLLMSAPGVPLWNTGLLPCLFTVSALDTGIALVEIIATASSKQSTPADSTHKLFGKSVLCLASLEIVILATFLGTMLAGGSATASSLTGAYSASLLMSGALAPYFWILVVICGLVVPITVNAIGLRKSGKHPIQAVMTAATCALVGGCALRFVIVLAGVHADVVAESVMRFFS